MNSRDHWSLVDERCNCAQQCDVIDRAIIRIQHCAECVGKRRLCVSEILSIDPLSCRLRRFSETFYSGGCQRDLKNSESVERHANAGLLGEILYICGIYIARCDSE